MSRWMSRTPFTRPPSASHEHQEQRVRRGQDGAHGGLLLPQRPHGDHYRSGQRRPGRVDRHQRGQDEPGKGQRYDAQGEHRHLRARRVRQWLRCRVEVGAEKSRNTRYSTAMATSHGATINPANRVNVNPLAANASRFVRFETGSSSEAVLAKCVHAYTCGRGRAPTRAAVANTTGVSSTTVASRLSTAVVSAATTNTPESSRPGPRRLAAINGPGVALPAGSRASPRRRAPLWRRGSALVTAAAVPLRLLDPGRSPRAAWAFACAGPLGY
jgi:hypothetical protein